MGGDSCSEGRGFESEPNILDGHFHIYIYIYIYIFAVKYLMFVQKDNNK